MPDGDPRGGDAALRDVTYDGIRSEDGFLSHGLGQLTDGETGHTNFRVDALGRGRGQYFLDFRLREINIKTQIKALILFLKL